MSGRNLYERVRAAYGLDEDELLRGLSSEPPRRPAASRGGSIGGSGHGNHNGSIGSGRIAASSSMPGNPAQTGSQAAGYANAWSVVGNNGGGYGNSGIHSQSTGHPARYNPAPAQNQNNGQSSNGPAHQAMAQQLPPPVAIPPLEKVNSVRVPFDPEDQSDDEVVITTAYNRKVRNGEWAPPAAEENGSDGSQSTPKRSLSATAAPFCPKGSVPAPDGTSVPAATAATSTSPAEKPKDLVHIRDANGNPNNEAKIGQAYPGPRTGFCPWNLVLNYHLWFVGRQNGELIKPYFAKKALLKAQVWDFCYLWQPVADEDGKPGQPSKTPLKHIVLVPASQFQHFLNRINKTHGIQLIIPSGPAGEKFRVVFGQQRTPVPRFLGRAEGEITFNSIVRGIPAFNVLDGTDRMKPQAKNMYEKKIASLLLSYDKNKMEQKIQKAEKLLIKRKAERQTVGSQIKRVQRYLGLRHKAAGQGQLPSPSPLDLTKPPPYAPEGDVVIVSMDIESYEYNHHALTEIGFGVLDTRDIAGIAPGAQCQDWFKLIQARHIRIREHASMVNRNFVHGCEENFNFGQSEFVKLADVLQVITRILQPRLAGGEPRTVVLLGHDIRSDISMVAQVGFIVKDEMFLEIIDTQNLHQNFRMRPQQTGLRGVLNDLEIEHMYLHNGGNDAVYTLQAMISLAVQKRQGSLQRQSERLQPGFAVAAEVLEQGWGSGGEGSDGGYAAIDKMVVAGTAAKEKEVATSFAQLGKGLSVMALGDHSEDLIEL